MAKKSQKKRHDMMVSHLGRQSVIPDQKKCDKIGITKDHVKKIHHEISTLRYELIDILHSNGMKTPYANVQNTAGELPSQSDIREFLNTLPESSRGIVQHKLRPLTPIQEDPQEYMFSTEPSTPVISALTEDKSPVKLCDVRAETQADRYIMMSEGDETKRKGTIKENEVKLRESKEKNKNEKTITEVKESKKRDTKLQEHSTKRSIGGKLKINVDVFKKWLKSVFT